LGVGLAPSKTLTYRATSNEVASNVPRTIMIQSLFVRVIGGLGFRLPVEALAAELFIFLYCCVLIMHKPLSAIIILLRTIGRRAGQSSNAAHMNNLQFTIHMHTISIDS
jgi:hypothetical protein